MSMNVGNFSLLHVNIDVMFTNPLSTAFTLRIVPFSTCMPVTHLQMEICLFNSFLIISLFLSVSQKANTECDIFVCVVLSHGDYGVFETYDAPVQADTILEYFKGHNCRGLAGKPKIFIFQVRFMWSGIVFVLN